MTTIKTSRCLMFTITLYSRSIKYSIYCIDLHYTLYVVIPLNIEPGRYHNFFDIITLPELCLILDTRYSILDTLVASLVCII